MYGGRCVCCGIDRPIFLALDHVQNDGNVERSGGSNRSSYRRAVKEYRPDRYQILCHNCNFAKHWEDNHTCKEL